MTRHVNKVQEIRQAAPAIQPNPTRPVWLDAQMQCNCCSYAGQDIDTYPAPSAIRDTDLDGKRHICRKLWHTPCFSKYKCNEYAIFLARGD